MANKKLLLPDNKTSKYIENNVFNVVVNCSCASFGVYFPSCEAKKITLEWAQKQFVTELFSCTTYESTNNEENNDPHASTPFLVRPDRILPMTS